MSLEVWLLLVPLALVGVCLAYWLMEANRYASAADKWKAMQRRSPSRTPNWSPSLLRPVPIDWSYGRRDTVLLSIGYLIGTAWIAIDHDAPESLQLARTVSLMVTAGCALFVSRFGQSVRSSLRRLAYQLRAETMRLAGIVARETKSRVLRAVLRLSVYLTPRGVTLVRDGPPIATESGILTAHARRGPPVFAIPRG